MQPLNHRNVSRRILRLAPPVVFKSVFVVLCLLGPAPAWAGGVVTNCTEASLRAAMAGGGTVTFACDGTITLGNMITCSSDTALDGTGHDVTISGNCTVPVFYVNPAVTLSVSNLTIADGRASQGAGILNAGGTVNLNTVTFRLNIAPVGGAIYNASGQMILQSCDFTDNRASTAYASQATFGGAIYNLASMDLDNCQFTGNTASGASGTFIMGIGPVGPGEGSGGAIYNAGQLTIDRTTFSANATYGGMGYIGPGITGTLNGDTGGNGANGFGGAICNLGSLGIDRSTLCSNVVMGGSGGQGGYGIWYMDIGGNGGNGGNGAIGRGGALFNAGSAELVNCTITASMAQGGTGGTGGSGAGKTGYGGNGGGGGIGIDGGVSGSCSFVNCTIAWNASVGGAGGAGGGAINFPPGLPGSSGSASGANPTGFLLNTLLFSNHPAGNDTFADPKLGPLADHGGPTLTMALQPDSPAINAGSAVGAPAADQRGVVRPQGPGVDIGAFEFRCPQFVGTALENATNYRLQMTGLEPCQAFAVQVSSNLLNWIAITNFIVGTNGGLEFCTPLSPAVPAHFYRLKAVAP